MNEGMDDGNLKLKEKQCKPCRVDEHKSCFAIRGIFEDVMQAMMRSSFIRIHCLMYRF